LRIVGGAGLTTRRATFAGVIIALATCALGIVMSSGAGGAATAAPGTPPPNFVVILVDDQAMNTFKPAYMPRTFDDIVDQGTWFKNGIAAPPLCCPDRAGILTGEYPHNHGVFTNDPGYPDLRQKRNTLPVWLQRAGYSTGLVGKFMNHYTDTVGVTPAPGFDSWFGMMEPFRHYTDYNVSDNGKLVHFGDARSDYSTDVFTQRANQFLRNRSHSSAPFFLWLGYQAPHGQSRSTISPCLKSAAPPDSASVRAVEHIPLPRPPSFNEADMSDKPRAIRGRPRLSHEKIQYIEDNWHCALAAMGEVDKGVDSVMQELEDDGEADNTIVIYVSDNGFFFGEHRLPNEKSAIYEPALNVPFAVRVPPAYRRGSRVPTSPAVVTNQDIGATLIAYAGQYLGHRVRTCARAGRCRRMDGRSFAPLVGGSGKWPANRGALVEIHSGVNIYHAIRTPQYAYSELKTGERELYDLHADPFELHNKAGGPKYAAIQHRLAARLTTLRKCSGIRGRDTRRKHHPFCE
jgi:arylsulfatase A-like enzyme